MYHFSLIYNLSVTFLLLFRYIEDLAKERMNITMETVRWMKLLQGLISIVQCFCGELPFFYLAGS